MNTIWNETFESHAHAPGWRKSSVRTKQSRPVDIEVTQYCSGVGGRSDELGVIHTVYRYYAQGWQIVSTTFAFTGQWIRSMKAIPAQSW